jgi:hypothetical protein
MLFLQNGLYYKMSVSCVMFYFVRILEKTSGLYVDFLGPNSSAVHLTSASGSTRCQFSGCDNIKSYRKFCLLTNAERENLFYAHYRSRTTTSKNVVHSVLLRFCAFSVFRKMLLFWKFKFSDKDHVSIATVVISDIFYYWDTQLRDSGCPVSDQLSG